MKQTYCTTCKKNVEMTNLNYIRLANNRLAIEGYCAICSGKLLKTKVMPKTAYKEKEINESNKKKKRNKI